jgi:hypothetical protein
MASSTTLTPSNSDIDLVKLAREIAMDIQPIETILEQYDINLETWSKIKDNPKFRALLTSEVEAWGAALNTSERLKLKAAAMLEEWLPELNNRLHDGQEALPAKIEGAKMLTRIAGIGVPGVVEGGAGERFTVMINLGNSAAPIEISKQIAPKIIEGEVIGGDEQV